MTTIRHPKFPDPKIGTYQLSMYENVIGSPSKVKNKFGNANRFPEVKNFGPKKMSYDLGNTISRRAAGFGIGDRFKSFSSKSKYCVRIVSHFIK